MYREFHLAGGSSGVPGDIEAAQAFAATASLTRPPAFQDRLNALFNRREIEDQKARSSKTKILQNAKHLLEDVLKEVLEEFRASGQHETLNTIQDLIHSADPDLPTQILKTNCVSRLRVPDCGALTAHENWGVWCAPIEKAFMHLTVHGAVRHAWDALESDLSGRPRHPIMREPEIAPTSEEKLGLALMSERNAPLFPHLTECARDLAARLRMRLIP